MTRRLVGATASCLVLFAGLWLILQPFALGSQPDGAEWTDQTLTDVWSGIGVAVVGLIGVVAFVAALVRNLADRGLISPRPARAESLLATATVDAAPEQGDAAGVSSDVDKLLAPLVAALAHDLERDRDPRDGELAHLADSRLGMDPPGSSDHSGSSTTSDHPRETR